MVALGNVGINMVQVKICLLTRYFDFRNAGIGRVSTEVMKGIVKNGYSVHAISTNGDSLYSYFLYTLAGIPMKLPRQGIDVYHALTPMEAIWLPKDKSVVTFHDLFQITNPDKLGSGMGYSKWKNFVGTNYFAIACNVAKHCRFIVAVSEQTKKDLIEYLNVPEEKISVIHSGIRPDLMPVHKWDKTFRIGYLGQLDRRKRINLLVEAFKGSSLEELVIGGTGVDGAMLKAQAGGDTRIKFLGRVPDNELVDFYNQLDVFMFPTWLEGYGLPPIEAMACKKPVVVLADARIPWEIKKRCVVTENLNMLLGNKGYLERLCKTIDIEGNYQFAKGHDWDKCVDKYLELYREISG